MGVILIDPIHLLRSQNVTDPREVNFHPVVTHFNYELVRTCAHQLTLLWMSAGNGAADLLVS